MKHGKKNEMVLIMMMTIIIIITSMSGVFSNPLLLKLRAASTHQLVTS